VNHTEPEFLLQAVNEIKVRVCEANGRRLEFLVLHESQFRNRMIGLSLRKSIEVARRQLTDSS